MRFPNLPAAYGGFSRQLREAGFVISCIGGFLALAVGGSVFVPYNCCLAVACLFGIMAWSGHRDGHLVPAWILPVLAGIGCTVAAVLFQDMRHGGASMWVANLHALVAVLLGGIMACLASAIALKLAVPFLRKGTCH